ncbi:MAG TPA: YqgE/AlgH family protein [Alphaproteobacteria bacterium]|nr:YqgE/AlgH family protein [Alphaproteobacteria bacterium]
MNADNKKPELSPEQKAVKAQKSRRDGYVLIFLALMLFAVGTYFRESDSAHHKLLVHNGAVGSVFEQSVLVMLKHDASGGYGVIINRPDEKNPGYFVGGPMEPEKISALYKGVANFEGGVPVGDTGLYYIEGARAEELRKLNPPPAWFIVIRGYAGWSPRQLDREILREWWKIADMDLPLVTETSPEFIWRAATDKAALAEEAAKRGIEPAALEEERKNKKDGL